MNKKKIMTKIITAVLVSGMMISAGSIAFAKTTGNSSAKAKAGITKQHKAFDKKNCPGMGNVFDTGMKTILDSAVKAGTITQDQEDKITAYMTQKQNDMKAEMEKVKAMSESERKAYFEQKKSEAKSKGKHDIMSELVSQNIISQDQADALKKLMPSCKDAKKQRVDMKTKLDNLVKAGTITQDQEDKITAYMTQKQNDMKAEMEKIKAMSESERKAYFDQKKSEAKSQGKVNPLKELVDQNVITQAQADAIFKAHK